MAGDGSEQLIIDGKRLDGRALDELRPTSIRVGILANADGSAEIRMGRNIIIAAVYGPRELHPKHRALPDKALIQCFYRMCTFSVKDRKSPAPSRREREISKIISEALETVVLTERFPRTTIDVYIQVLQADGGTRCASLTAASVALADAGIPMRGLISAVAAGLANDRVVLDLCDIEDQKGSGDVPVGYAPALNEISLLQLDGVFTIEQFKHAVSLAIDGAKTVYTLQQDALKQKYALIREEVAAQEEELTEVEKESGEIIKQSVEEKFLAQEAEELQAVESAETPVESGESVAPKEATKQLESATIVTEAAEKAEHAHKKEQGAELEKKVEDDVVATLEPSEDENEGTEQVTEQEQATTESAEEQESTKPEKGGSGLGL